MPSLGNDLALIRKELNLTLEDIQDKTKIPPHILSSIEDDSIFTDFEENTTYIRSYVRSYARTLNIDDDLIIKALDQQEEGNYGGLLGKGPDQRKTYEYDDLGEESEDDTVSKVEKTEEQEASKTKSAEKSTSATQKSKNEPPTVRSVDWADMGQKFHPLKTESKYWAGILLVLFIALAALFAYYYLSNSDSNLVNNETGGSNETPAERNVVPDSLQLDVSPGIDDNENADISNDLSTDNEEQPPQTNLDALPDTLSLTIYAAYDKLEPVRVYTDIMDDINPYWIEQGNAFAFEFVNTIRIRGQFTRMVLIFNGHLIQNIREQFYNPDTRLVEIDRSFFENDPRWLEAPPDSLEIDAPAPNVIQNRPTFN